MKKPLVALVVGHSKKSKGAYNRNLKLKEYDLNEQEAILVASLLIEQKIDSILIYRDTYRKLPKDINKHKPTIIVSFHHNSFSKTATGTETLYYYKSKKSKKLAQIMQNEIVNALGYKDRGIRPKGIEDKGGYLLKYTKAPCIILEPCFISNDIEALDFLSKKEEYAQAITKGIQKYINNK